MKYTTAILALAATVYAAADPYADFPTCAQQELKDAVTKAGCGLDDLACVCKNFDAIEGSATGPILKSCGQDVALNQVLPASEALCKNPPAGGSSSAAPSASAPASSAAPSASAPASSAAPTESAPASSAPSASAPDSSAAPTAAAPTESAPASASATASGSTTLATAPAGTGAASGSGVVTQPSGVPVSGAAALSSVGALAMVVLGALAL